MRHTWHALYATAYSSAGAVVDPVLTEGEGEGKGKEEEATSALAAARVVSVGRFLNFTATRKTGKDPFAALVLSPSSSRSARAKLRRVIRAQYDSIDDTASISAESGERRAQFSLLKKLRVSYTRKRIKVDAKRSFPYTANRIQRDGTCA